MSKELQFLMYNTPEENVSVNAVIKDETIWLTQKAMAELFDCTTDYISLHLKNIYAVGELNESSTTEEFSIVQQEGSRKVKRKIKFYNLDAIISVGYRVNSRKATHFRIWATGVLKEYMIKGFAIYAMVQNKFHYAITGQTAAEIIYSKSDRNKENMGLTTWKNAPDGRILKSDVTVAKNYLEENQIKQLERAISGYFDYIEDLIERENTFTMQEFSESINEFLSFRKYKILKDKGSISKKQADAKAEEEYIHFNKTQNIISDFDREVKKLIAKGGDYVE